MRHLQQRGLLVALFAFAFVLTTAAQKVDIRALFSSIPTTVAPLLTEERKSDFLNKYDAQKGGQVYTSPIARQLFYSAEGGIKEMTSDYLLLQLDDKSSMQLKVLPKGWRGYLVGVVLTSEVEPKQSVLLFYNQKWQQLPTQEYFKAPLLGQFLTDDHLLTLNNVKQLFGEVGTLAYSYEWSPEEPLLRVRITTFDTALYKRLYPEAKKWVIPEGITYQWKRGKLRIR